MPKDQWKFIPSDDNLSDDSPAEEPEETAVHIEPDFRVACAEDPGRSDVELADHGTDDWEGTPVRHLDDEQSEFGDDGENASDTESEDDLERILEEQHYAFDNKDEEG